MRFVFFGSFHLSARILDAYVAKGGELPAVVVCSPDRPAGRKKILTPPAIKQLILEKKWPIKILQPEKLPTSTVEIEHWKSEIGEVDLGLVMGYPHIISKAILDIPRLGTIGVHPSLLPLYRGASPMQSALLDGATETGVSIYQMDDKMDHGPIFAQEKIAIDSNETNTSLESKVIDLAGAMLTHTLPLIASGKITPVEQNHTQATFTRKFSTEDAQVNMASDARETIYNKIRALNPEPGCWTMNLPGYEGKRVKLLEAQRDKEGLIISKIHVDGKKPTTVHLLAS